MTSDEREIRKEKTMSANARCEKCHRTPCEDRVTLYRVNPPGEEGIFRCRDHYAGEIDPDVELITHAVQSMARQEGDEQAKKIKMGREQILGRTVIVGRGHLPKMLPQAMQQSHWVSLLDSSGGGGTLVMGCFCSAHLIAKAWIEERATIQECAEIAKDHVHIAS